MAEIEFYTNPMSRGQIVRWMLEEIGEPYEEKLLSYGPEMKSDAYLKLNPMGKVPTVVHKGRVITECAAICAYMAEAFPEKDLTPTAEERADYYRWMFFGAGPLEQAMTANSLGWKPKDAKEGATTGFGSYDLVVDTLASHFAKHDYVCGARFTAADVYVGAQVDWGMMFKTMPVRPEFEAYAGRLRDRAAYKKAKARDGELIAAMQAAEEG
ncbi:MAG: glutathione S-transferase family protein [Pseudomonadota bacterium]